MKKIAIAAVATAGLLLGTATFAASKADSNAAPAATSSNLVIGVIDLSDVLKNSPQMKAAASKLKKEFKPRQEKIKNEQKKLAENQEKLKRNSSVMSQSDLQGLQTKVADERRDLQRMQEDYMQDLQTAQQQAMQSVLKKIDGIVQDIATKGHYDLILQRNTIAFASPRVDITSQVTKQLDK